MLNEEMLNAHNVWQKPLSHGFYLHHLPSRSQPRNRPRATGSRWICCSRFWNQGQSEHSWWIPTGRGSWLWGDMVKFDERFEPRTSETRFQTYEMRGVTVSQSLSLLPFCEWSKEDAAIGICRTACLVTASSTAPSTISGTPPSLTRPDLTGCS